MQTLFQITFIAGIAAYFYFRKKNDTYRKIAFAVIILSFILYIFFSPEARQGFFENGHSTPFWIEYVKTFL